MTNVELLVENVKRGKADIDNVYKKGLADGTKEEQEKSVIITENGTTEIVPDENKVLSKVTVEVDVESSGGTWDFTKYLFSMQLNASVVEITDNIYFDLSAFGSGLTYFANNVPFSCAKITVKLSDKVASMQNAFTNNLSNVAQDKLKEIEIIGSTGGVTNFADAFSRKSLERITGEIDFSSCTYIYRCFNNATSLKKLRIKPNSISISVYFANSPDLTDESVDSIVNGFADITGQTAPVLTVHPTVKTKIEADDAKEDTDPTKRFWLRTLTSKNVTLA